MQYYLSAMLPLLLLHGALGAAADLKPLAHTLGTDFETHTPDFPGHGGTAMPDRPLDLRFFAEETLRYMDSAGIERAHIFGYSMGGCVGMLAAAASPERIASVATLGTKYFWDEDTAADEARKLNPEKMEEKVPAFAGALAAMHGAENWKNLVNKTRAMIQGMGANPPFPKLTENLSTVSQPCLVMLGDRDKMVTMGETLDAYAALPSSQLCVLPGTPHPIGQVVPEILAFHLRNFLLKT